MFDGVMNTYRITLEGRNQGDYKAKNAENALCNFLRALSATHFIRRGAYTEARLHNSNPVEKASVYLWESSYSRPVFAVAELR